ncbi:MAG: hypothetical protein Q4D38_13230 [Planctomycetia bacterium]|nr:hypothetical protein [Planctomycetia bacterium]
MQWYFYDKNGKQGPISDADIRFFASTGIIKAGTIIETEDGKQGLARSVQGLFSSEESAERKVAPPPIPSMVKKTEPPCKRDVVPPKIPTQTQNLVPHPPQAPPKSQNSPALRQDAIDYLDERMDHAELRYDKKLQELENTVLEMKDRSDAMLLVIEKLNERVAGLERIIRILINSVGEEASPPEVAPQVVHQAYTPPPPTSDPPKSRGLLGAVAALGIGLALGMDL